MPSIAEPLRSLGAAGQTLALFYVLDGADAGLAGAAQAALGELGMHSIVLAAGSPVSRPKPPMMLAQAPAAGSRWLGGCVLPCLVTRWQW